MTIGQRTNRIVDVDRTQLTEYQEKVIARLESGRGTILPPYKIWIQSPVIADGMEVIGTHLNTGSSFDYAEREIGILMTAVFWRSPFVITAHLRHARTAGVAEPALESILAGTPARFANERQQAVHDFVQDSLAGGSIEDAAFFGYEQIFGRAGIAELLTLIGYYTSVALGLRMHEVPPPVRQG
ncbi:MAG TPA: carboxymuconolactone decarboxylase [Xanthobacteraceae bacterium]|nr:carboxymuconolactone decarboxylase [Xanthobacteraceae bacterium]